MNGLEVRKVYYNLDGSADWLKSTTKTVYTYIDTENTICVESVAATRTLNLYYRKIDAWRR